MSAQTSAQSQTKFARTVARTGRWRGVKASASEAGDKTPAKFSRLKNHKNKNQPQIIQGKAGVRFNDTGYSAFNAYLIPERKGFFKRDGSGLTIKKDHRLRKLKVVRK